MNKSRQYPVLTLKNAIEIIGQARNLGKTINKATLSTIGSRADSKGSIKSGAFVRKLAAIKNYGLIKIDGENINFTETAEGIIHFQNPDEQKANTIKAFLTPHTFYSLFTELEKNVPLNVNLIRNKAIREIGISSAGSLSFMNCFISSGIFAGLIEYASDDKQIIRLLNPTETEKVEVTKPESKINTNINTRDDFSLLNPFFEKPKDQSNQKIEYQTATLILSLGKATIQVPPTISEQDKTRLKAQIDVFLTNKQEEG